MLTGTLRLKNQLEKNRRIRRANNPPTDSEKSLHAISETREKRESDIHDTNVNDFQAIAY